ncbi:MAG: hypothetical protein HRF50_06970 [Phycisphaerae bacterium]|jgi:hypothetical protein
MNASRIATCALLLGALALSFAAPAQSLGVRLAPDTLTRQDAFGASVAISGDLALVGAPSCGLCPLGSGQGAAYLFRRQPDELGAWIELLQLAAGDPQLDDGFGFAVAIDGDVAVVGAPFRAGPIPHAGAVHVFERDHDESGQWGEVVRLSLSAPTPQEQFGISVGVSGDVIVVGAWRYDVPYTDCGAAYVYEREPDSPRSWRFVRRLTPNAPAAVDLFGREVAVFGDRIVVGAVGDDSAGDSAGAAYIFERDAGGPGAWGEAAKLVGNDTEALDLFGASVAVYGDTVAVSAPGGDGAAFRSGTTYLFHPDAEHPGAWHQAATLVGDPVAWDQAGAGVALWRDLALIGNPLHDNAGSDSGISRLFLRDRGGVGAWEHAATISAAEVTADDGFGAANALWETWAVVGASGDDGACEGDPNCNSGAAYVFDLRACRADVDLDGAVGLSDLSNLLSNFGVQSGASFDDGDLDLDGDVELADLSDLLASYGKTCP